MARFRWTEEAIAELRRQINYERTYAEIGAMLGCSADAIRAKMQRLGWSDMGRAAFLRSRRFKGRKRPSDVMQRIAEASRDRAADPEYRKRLQRQMAENAASPKRMKAVRAAITQRRGFAVPASQDEAYQAVRRKKFSAREAGAILGLIPQATGGR